MTEYNRRVLNIIGNELNTWQLSPTRVIDALRQEGYHIVSTPEIAIDHEDYDPRFDFNFGVGSRTFVHLGMEVDAEHLAYSQATHYTNFRAIDWLTTDMARRFGFELLQKLIDEG